MLRRLTLPLFAVLLCPISGSFAAESAAEPVVDFNRDIRPLLAANCYACHGPDAETREADLRLDLREAAVKALDGRRAIVPGNRPQSEFWKRISSSDPDLVMPPPDSGHKLKPEQIERLGRWIDSGAGYARHWSYLKPVAVALPNVQNSDWARNGIDWFILQRLEAAGLKPESEADRAALIRRVSLDLTGLPPTPEQLDAFLNDSTPDAYEQLVDRLLNSERFGEHWARMWLDLARYADTKGYEKDQPRDIWRYRDWVINAFNADLPYDRFTIEQMAGDLLPDAASDQILATAFHRNTMTNDEGGTDNEEFRIAAVKDRVDTTVQVWMGLTMGCAKCHSHKYDPIEQREYYAFFDFFNQTEDADRPDDAPRVPTPTIEQSRQLANLSERISEQRSRVQNNPPGYLDARRDWETSIASGAEWTVLKLESAVSEANAKLATLPDGSLLASGNAPEKDVYTLTSVDPGQAVSAIRIDALTDESLGRGGPGRNPADPNFVLSELELSVVLPDGATRRLPLKNARADFSQGGWDVAAAIDGNPATGWAVSPEFGKPHVAIFELAEPLPHESGTKLVVILSQQYGQKLVLGRFRVSIASADPSLLKPVVTTLADLAAIPEDKRGRADSARLDSEFRRVFPATAALIADLDTLEKQKSEVEAAIVKTPVMRDLPEARRRDTRIHVRGNFLQPGDAVRSAVPAAFHPLPESAPENRLGVAQWLVSPENPLTARVAVNRFWARFFGIGLVETEEDFGIQGTSPSHPELLDWLAVQFSSPSETGLHWSMKKLCRQIVTSATYRQSSHVAPEKLAADPQNRLLSRAPRFRLPAETIRDQALAVSGLLSSKVGGASVMPPQPPGIWKATYSRIQWETSSGDDRYRRALYTFWRRTSPYPSMLTFDAGSREVCVIRRVRTNTPLQALVTLNDPVFVEAAGALGQRLIATGPDTDSRINSGFRRVLMREPSAAELARLRAFAVATQSELATEPAAANRLLKAAGVELQNPQRATEFAVWTVVGNVLLNLDEFLTRD